MVGLVLVGLVGDIYCTMALLDVRVVSYNMPLHDFVHVFLNSVCSLPFDIWYFHAMKCDTEIRERIARTKEARVFPLAFLV